MYYLNHTAIPVYLMKYQIVTDIQQLLISELRHIMAEIVKQLKIDNI